MRPASAQTTGEEGDKISNRRYEREGGETKREVDLRFSPAAAVFHLLVYHGKREKGGRGLLLPLLLLPSAAAAEAGLIISRSEASERTKAEEKENERTLPIISPQKKKKGKTKPRPFFSGDSETTSSYPRGVFIFKP